VAGLRMGGAVLSASIDGPGISDALPFQFGGNRYGVVDNMVSHGCALMLMSDNRLPHSVGSAIGFGINFYQESLYRQVFLIMTVITI
jgi:hypothetical protein